jgi:DNA-binding Lrp family transcriptional regulator
MVTSFVLISTVKDSEGVIKQLKKEERVKEIYSVYGVYDIVAKIRAKTVNEIRNIVPRHIRRLENVQSVLTMIIE